MAPSDRLNLHRLRTLAPAEYAHRLAIHPDTPIIVDGRTSLADLRQATLDGVVIDSADHAYRLANLDTYPDYDPQAGVDRILAARLAAELVERSSPASREKIEARDWLSPTARALLDLLHLTDTAERQSIRWNEPFPVESWVGSVRDIIARALIAAATSESGKDTPA